jgi:hypothetical protein
MGEQQAGKRAFVLMLKENYKAFLSHGVVGHATKLEDDPLTAGDGRFFAVVSDAAGVHYRRIHGPFRQTCAQYYDDTDIGLVRRVGDTSAVLREPCPHRFRAEEADPGVSKTEGLLWEEAAKLLGVDLPAEWSRILLTPDQFDLLSVHVANASLDSPASGLYDAADDEVWTTEDVVRDIFGGSWESYGAWAEGD